ncbi:unnamed protein product, partial [marine sediment metagenome]
MYIFLIPLIIAIVLSVFLLPYIIREGDRVLADQII